MACKMEQMSFIASPASYPANSAWYYTPFTPLLPTSEFDRVRVTAENLSTLGSTQYDVAYRKSDDGITFGSWITISVSPINPSSTQFAYLPFEAIPGASDSARFVQLGLAAQTTGPTTQQSTVVRLNVDFKMGD